MLMWMPFNLTIEASSCLSKKRLVKVIISGDIMPVFNIMLYYSNLRLEITQPNNYNKLCNRTYPIRSYSFGEITLIEDRFTPIIEFSQLLEKKGLMCSLIKDYPKERSPYSII